MVPGEHGMAVTGSRVLGGRYVLTEVLGTGGMASVWRAHDQVLGREVAVKVLGQQYAADPGFTARFEREARHAASVSHPRLVTVLDSGFDRGMPFLVMELVTGQTLRQVLDEAGPLPPGQAVAIAAAVCEGLDAAHTARLVHRDITPANIMLAGGEVKILAEGAAKMVVTLRHRLWPGPTVRPPCRYGRQSDFERPRLVPRRIINPGRGSGPMGAARKDRGDAR